MRHPDLLIHVTHDPLSALHTNLIRSY